MIDWHSHILSGMDDGSRDVQESVSMLEALRAQGVDTVIATPHFYANDESLESFLSRRNDSYLALKEQLTEELPRILLGAEVRYYPGICRMSDLERLTIGSTSLLLIEMPMRRWTEYTVKELIELAGSPNVTVVMAHVERYLSLQSSSVWKRLRDCGILMQINASFFDGAFKRRKAFKLLEKGYVQLIGTDCHNMTSRPPAIDVAYSFIDKKLGHRFVSRMIKFGYNMLNI